MNKKCSLYSSVFLKLREKKSIPKQFKQFPFRVEWKFHAGKLIGHLSPHKINFMVKLTARSIHPQDVKNITTVIEKILTIENPRPEYFNSTQMLGLNNELKLTLSKGNLKLILFIHVAKSDEINS